MTLPLIIRDASLIHTIYRILIRTKQVFLMSPRQKPALIERYETFYYENTLLKKPFQPLIFFTLSILILVLVFHLLCRSAVGFPVLHITMSALPALSFLIFSFIFSTVRMISI